MPVLSGGTATAGPNPLKLQGVADALLYLGPRDSLTVVDMPRADLEGTPYGREIARRVENSLRPVPEYPLGSNQDPAVFVCLVWHLRRCPLHRKVFTILRLRDQTSWPVL